jgi:hypothetical protein
MLKEFLLTEDKNKGSVRVLEVLEVLEVFCLRVDVERKGIHGEGLVLIDEFQILPGGLFTR